MTTTTRQIDPAKILNKAVQKLSEASDEYDAVTSTITTQKLFQEQDYDELMSRLTAAMSIMRSVRAALKRLAAKQTEIPGMADYTTNLIDAAEAFERVLTGLRHKAQLTGRYGYFRYRREYNDFLSKHQTALINRYEYQEQVRKSPESPSSDTKTVTTAMVANEFLILFEENILKITDKMLQALTDEHSGTTMKVDEDTARVAIFHALLMFWMLPIWNCFEETTGQEIIIKILIGIAEVHEMDVHDLTKRILDIRRYYIDTFDENARLRRNSAWLVDDLTTGVDYMTYSYIDAIMIESTPLRWGKIAEELTIIRSEQ